MKTHPKLVPFSQRRDEFHALQSLVKEYFGDKLGLWISDVRYDRYGLYRSGERRALVLIDGDKLADFDLSTVET